MAQLEMLAHNARTPAALLGYYAVVPGQRVGVFCLRLDLRKVADPAEAIAFTIDSLAETFSTSLAESVEAITAVAHGVGIARATTASPGASPGR